MDDEKKAASEALPEAAKAKTVVLTLPPGVRKRLDEFTSSLQSALGADLVGILVHGSVVRSEYRPGESNVDVLVILKKADFAHLDAIGEAAQLARYSARIEALIVTEEEIDGASDAFPLFYDEIKQRHILLVGRDPIALVQVHDTHRRLRIEQELRETQFMLRRAVIDSFGAREAVGGAVARKVRQVRVPLLALLALKGIPCAPDLPSVLAKIGETYGVDVAPLGQAREAPEAAHGALVALLTRTIDDVNAMDPVSRARGAAR